MKVMLSYSRSLSDLKNRIEKIAEREQNLIIFSAIVFPIAEKISELWAAQVFLQPIPFKSDRLLVTLSAVGVILGLLLGHLRAFSTQSFSDRVCDGTNCKRSDAYRRSTRRLRLALRYRLLLADYCSAA